MALSPETSDDYEQLREQLRRYEASLESAKGRLVAFARLEEIAKERHQSPEVVAARAAIELLETQESTLRAEVTALQSQRESTKEDLSMLLVSKKQTIIELEDVRGNREELADEVAVMLNEIEAIRSDARRLNVEKGELETEVMELRLAVQTLERKAASLQENPGRRESDVDTDLSDDADELAVNDGEEALSVGMNNDEHEAFDRFFNANDVDEKARTWMLG